MSGRGFGGLRMPNISADGLKNFACGMMLIQTVGISVVQNGLIHVRSYDRQMLSEALAADSNLMLLAGVGSVMQLIGGLAVPIFAFLLVEGFKNTASYQRYLLSVLGTALVSEVPYDLAMSQKWLDKSSQNPLFSAAVCLLMLYFLRMIEEKMVNVRGDGSGKAGSRIWGIFCKTLVIAAAVIWVSVFRCGYGFCLVLLTADFYLLYRANVLKTILGVLISFLYVTGPLAFYGIWCYDGTRKHTIPKVAYYGFYPIHLFIFGVLSLWLSKSIT